MKLCRAAVPALVSLLALAGPGCESAPVTPALDAGPVDTCTARYTVARRDREVIFAVDRSCAMRSRWDGTTGTGPDDPESRWAAVRAALGTASADPSIAGWGLALFPETATSCEVPAMAVEPSAGDADALRAALELEGADAFALCPDGTGEVPLEAGLTSILASKQVGAAGEPLVVVIVAGTPSCAASAESLMALGTSFRDVVVLALAPDAAALPLLEAIGEVRPVTSAGEVAGAIDAAIAAHEAGCVLDLEGPLAADPEQLRVWIDGEPVAADPDEGWSYSSEMSITLNGARCDALTGGTITRVDVALGCDERRCVARDEACDGLDDDCDDITDEECS